jgi:hypothetical protein
MQGNSLIELLSDDFLISTQDHERTKLVSQLNKLKNELFDITSSSQKDSKRREIDSLIKTIFEYDKNKVIHKLKQKIVAIRSQTRLFEDEIDKKNDHTKIKEIENKIEELGKIKIPGLSEHFEWHINFSEVFQEKDGFDLVIANPPYVRIQNLRYQEIDFYKKRYWSAYKRLDLSILFLELAHKIMRYDGNSVYITSSQFTKTEYGRKIREVLLKSLRSIVYFGDNQIFESATNYTSLFFFANNIKDKSIIFTNAEKYMGKVDLNEYIKENQSIIKRNSLKDSSWELEKSDISEILNKIKLSKFKQLYEIADIEYGLVTGLDSVLVFKKNKLNLGNSQFVYPLLKPLNTDRYQLTRAEYCVVYPYTSYEDRTVIIDENKLKQSAPKLYKYLLLNKNKLLLRKDSRQSVDKDTKIWYALMRHSSFQKVQREKILTQALCKHNEFCLDTNGQFFTGGSIYSISSKLIDVTNKSLLGLLNSKVCEFFYQLVCPIRQHGYRFYAGTFLKSLPIPQDFFKESEKLHFMVEKILGITEHKDYIVNPEKQKKVKNYEKQIDQMVYGLYGLTKEEITIIEKSI